MLSVRGISGLPPSCAPSFSKFLPVFFHSPPSRVVLYLHVKVSCVRHSPQSITRDLTNPLSSLQSPHSLPRSSCWFPTAVTLHGRSCSTLVGHSWCLTKPTCPGSGYRGPAVPCAEMIPNTQEDDGAVGRVTLRDWGASSILGWTLVIDVWNFDSLRMCSERVGGRRHRFDLLRLLRCSVRRLTPWRGWSVERRVPATLVVSWIRKQQYPRPRSPADGSQGLCWRLSLAQSVEALGCEFEESDMERKIGESNDIGDRVLAWG